MSPSKTTAPLFSNKKGNFEMGKEWVLMLLTISISFIILLLIVSSVRNLSYVTNRLNYTETMTGLPNGTDTPYLVNLTTNRNLTTDSLRCANTQNASQSNPAFLNCTVTNAASGVINITNIANTVTGAGGINVPNGAFNITFQGNFTAREDSNVTRVTQNIDNSGTNFASLLPAMFIVLVAGMIILFVKKTMQDSQ